MTDIKNLILRCGGVHAEHPMKHYRCTKSDLERFAAAIRREAFASEALHMLAESQGELFRVTRNGKTVTLEKVST